jgi:general secretion pathway protein M
VKEWWYSLAFRERVVLQAGAFVAAAMLIYMLAWHPAMQEQARLEARVKEQQALLGWMRAAAAQVERLRQAGSEGDGGGDGRSLLARVEESARRLEIADQLQRIQPDGGSVRLAFEGVSFDRLMQWLAVISEDGSVIVTDLALSRSKPPSKQEAGEGDKVDAKLILQGGGGS